MDTRDPPRPEQPASPDRRTITESQVARELGIDRLEVYLVAAATGKGQYDSVTHLLMFTDAEMAALATYLGRIQEIRKLGSNQFKE